MKKKTPQKATTTPRSQDKNVDSIQHYTAVLLEDMRDQIQLLAENQQVQFSSVRSEISEFKTNVNSRFETVESVLRLHSRELIEIKSDVSAIESNVSKIKKDVSTIKSDVSKIKTTVTAHGDQLRVLKEA